MPPLWLSPHAIRRTLQNRKFCLSSITEYYGEILDRPLYLIFAVDNILCTSNAKGKASIQPNKPAWAHS